MNVASEAEICLEQRVVTGLNHQGDEQIQEDLARRAVSKSRAWRNSSKKFELEKLRKAWGANFSACPRSGRQVTTYF
jgi:hypothetical protein